MTDPTAKTIIGFALLLVLFCLGLTSTPRYVDFVCYTHGVRTETQAGVLDSTRPAELPGLWIVAVEDAGDSFYLQRPGETCGLERAP